MEAQALRTRGWSISAIASHLGHDRKTIRAYLDGERRPGERKPAAVRVSGLDRALSTVRALWRKPMAIHDPAKVVCDLGVALAVGGDCLADVAVLRAEPAVFGLVASGSG